MVLPASSGWACPASCCGDGSQGRRRAPSAELGEELAEVAGEEVGGVVGGPVAAAVELAPGDDVGVVAVGEAAQGPEVVGEAGQPHGDGGGLGGVGGVVVLVVEAGRRGGGVGQPVDGHIGQEVVGAEGVAEQLAAPGELAGGGVGQGVGDGLGLGGLELVVDRPLHKPLEEGQVAELVGGQALQLGRVAGGEGEELGDMDPEDVVGVDPALEGGDDGAGVVAVGAVAPIAEAGHELGPGSGGAQGVPAGLGGGAGEAEAGQRGDDQVEGVGGVGPVGPGVGEGGGQVQVFQEGVGPAVGQDQREGVGLGRAEVREVDGLAVDGGGELRDLVELGLPGPPVVVVAPVVDQVLDIAEGDAVVPAGGDRAGLGTAGVQRGELVGPAGPGQPLGQIIQIGLRDLDPKRPDGGIGHDLSPRINDVCLAL